MAPPCVAGPAQETMGPGGAGTTSGSSGGGVMGSGGRSASAMIGGAAIGGSAGRHRLAGGPAQEARKSPATNAPTISSFPVSLLPSFQRCFRVEVRFLSINIPITQILQRDLALGDGARDETAGLDDLEVGVEVTKLGLARERSGGKRVHGRYMPPIATAKLRRQRAAPARSAGQKLNFDEIPASRFRPIEGVVSAFQAGPRSSLLAR